MHGLELTLLGVPTVSWQGQPLTLQPRHCELIAFLALSGPSARDDLAELFWGPGKSANLRTALYKLRQLPGAEEWLHDAEPVRVLSTSDVETLRKAVETAQFEAALPLLERDTLELLFGLKSPTRSFDEWLGEQRRETAELVSRALWGVAQHFRDEGQLSRAKQTTLKLIGLEPTFEPAYRLLMRLEHESGDVEGIREAFAKLTTVLSELGGEPAPETLKLRAELVGAEGAVAQATLFHLGDTVPGRAAELIGRAAVLEKLGAEVRQKPTVLHGFGGVGKTALAAEFAAHTLERGDVLWLHAGRSSEAELFDAARQALGVSGGDPKELTTALGWTVLLIIDDVWNVQAVGSLCAVLPAGLPVLATSRQRLPGFARIELGGLERSDARKLLDATAETTLPEASADELCHVLSDHPFALRLAGTQLRGGATPQNVLARLAGAPHTLHAPKSWRDEERESISALLAASLETLSDAAYDTFLAVGALGSSAVTPEFLALCLRRTPDETETALNELQTQALAERRTNPGSDVVRYLLHDLSYSFARYNGTLRAGSVLRACQTFVSENVHTFELLGAEMPNLVGALETARDQGQREVLVEVMAQLVIGDAYFSARGHSPRSLKLLEVALAWAKELGLLERAHYLAGRLGDAHRVLYHQYDKALTAYQEGARLARLIRNPSREATLTSLCAITRHYLGQSSEQDFERAYQIAKQADDDLVIGFILQHRSYVAWSRKNWRAMERFSQETVELATKLRQVLKTDQASVDKILFHGLTNLGEAKRKLDAFDEAVNLRLQALNIAISRDNQLWRADALHDLGEMYVDTAQFQEAESYLNEALELYETNHATAEAEEVRQMLLKFKHRTEFTPS